MPQDTHLQLEVLAELDWEPSVKAGHIGVTAAAGVVTLTGIAESYAEKHAAEVAARRVKGVRGGGAGNRSPIPFERQRGDTEIAAAALDRFAWDVSIPPRCRRREGREGWVSLTGEMEFHFQRDAAEQAFGVCMA